MIRPEDILSRGRGILAADESTNTVGKRLAAIGVENTEENRANFRRMLLTAPGIEKHVGGVILFDETFRQEIERKTVPRFLKSLGISPGIKVDKGLQVTDNNETITVGLDDLDRRLEEYRAMGAEFAKWRAVIRIGLGTPTSECIEKNCRALALYAKSCQEHHIVPIVEPETLIDGDHSLQECARTTSSVLSCLIDHLKKEKVSLENLILKVNMIVEGLQSPHKSTSDEVAKKTLAVLSKNWVPHPVVFLSGGQSEVRSTENLQDINSIKENGQILTFSYGRALQESAARRWKGREENAAAAQKILLHRAKMNWLASRGEYSKEAENA